MCIRDRCDSVYDFSHDYYYPCAPKIIEENICLLYFDAQDFFQRYTNDKKELYKMTRSFSKRNKYVILVLSELNKLKKAIDNLEDKRYKERVNERLSGSPSKTQSKKAQTKMDEIRNLNMNKDDLEKRIRFIDREWKVKIHTVNSYTEFIHSLPNLVSIIGKQRMDPAIRFMKYAHLNVKSGQDKKDILKKVFREIGKIPDLKANSILQAYPTFQTLLEDFENGQLKSGFDGRHLMTEMMEKKLHKLFTCKNPNEAL